MGEVLGSPGAPAGGVQSVQGVDGGFPLPVAGSLTLAGAPDGGLPVTDPAAEASLATLLADLDAGVGAMLLPGSNLVGSFKSAPPTSVSSYITPATSLTGKNGATWLTGSVFTIPAGVKSISWVVNWAHGGPTSQLSYRIQVGHANNLLGITRIRSTAPSIASQVATTTEYQSIVTLAEVGVNAVVPVTYENADGFAFAELDVQQAVVDGAGDGTVSVTIAGSFN